MKIARINVTPVKGLGLHHPDEVELTAHGVETNRRFYLISGWRLFNGKDHGPLVRIAPSVDNGRLRLDFPDGRVLDGEVELGEHPAVERQAHAVVANRVAWHFE